MNKYKKGALVISIILLVITLPLTVIGIIYNKEIKNVDNPSKLFHYDNKLYFYNEITKGRISENTNTSKFIINVIEEYKKECLRLTV